MTPADLFRRLGKRGQARFSVSAVKAEGHGFLPAIHPTKQLATVFIFVTEPPGKAH